MKNNYSKKVRTGTTGGHQNKPTQLSGFLIIDKYNPCIHLVNKIM